MRETSEKQGRGSYYTLMKALLALMFMTPLSWTKVIPISANNKGLPLDLDNDENSGALDMMIKKTIKAQGILEIEKKS